MPRSGRKQASIQKLDEAILSGEAERLLRYPIKSQENAVLGQFEYRPRDNPTKARMEQKTHDRTMSVMKECRAWDATFIENHKTFNYREPKEFEFVWFLVDASHWP